MDPTGDGLAYFFPTTTVDGRSSPSRSPRGGDRIFHSLHELSFEKLSSGMKLP